MELARFRFPTDICFGVGARRMLAEFQQTHGIVRPLVVTDDGFGRTEAFRMVATELERLWPGAWRHTDAIHSNPREHDVETAYAAYRDGDCDAVIGLGGGSAIDGAKAVLLRVAAPEQSLAAIALDALPPRITPLCAIPTTAGTGSEVGRSTVITLAADKRKAVFGAPALLPWLAILDPELTVGLPPHLTAATGMDALTHAIESYVCPVYHPMCDGIALEAIYRIRRFLPRAVRTGTDLEARGEMLMAAAMGAVAFQKDLGAAHSLAHPLSTVLGVHHGLANALVLPAVVRFNGEADREQYARVAAALDLSPGGDPARVVAEFLEAFRAEIGITQRLADVGVTAALVPELAREALADGCHLTNPRPCTLEDLTRLYQESL